jgi:hypothetical protein
MLDEAANNSTTLNRLPIVITPSTDNTFTSYSDLAEDDSLDESFLSDFAMQLFADWSIFAADGTINNIRSGDLPLGEEEEEGVALILMYGVQNYSIDQYSQGFQFSKGSSIQSAKMLPCHSLGYETLLTDQGTESSYLVLTFCPPHEVEMSSPRSANFISFDLGFSVIDINNQAYVVSLVENSPAMRVGVCLFYKIKFAFAHTLSSHFRNHIDDISLSSLGPISFLFESHPDVAVYHVGEQESRAAAAYAISCVQNGQSTSFQSFIAMFPFDITKPPDSYKPAEFVHGQEPILYPITVVFETKVDQKDNVWMRGFLGEIWCGLDSGSE